MAARDQWAIRDLWSCMFSPSNVLYANHRRRMSCKSQNASSTTPVKTLLCTVVILPGLVKPYLCTESAGEAFLYIMIGTSNSGTEISQISQIFETWGLLQSLLVTGTKVGDMRNKVPISTSSHRRTKKQRDFCLKVHVEKVIHSSSELDQKKQWRVHPQEMPLQLPSF